MYIRVFTAPNQTRCASQEVYKYAKETAMTRTSVGEIVKIVVLICAMTAWVWYWYEITH